MVRQLIDLLVTIEATCGAGPAPPVVVDGQLLQVFEHMIPDTTVPGRARPLATLFRRNNGRVPVPAGGILRRNRYALLCTSRGRSVRALTSTVRQFGSRGHVRGDDFDGPLGAPLRSSRTVFLPPSTQVFGRWCSASPERRAMPVRNVPPRAIDVDSRPPLRRRRDGRRRHRRARLA